LASRGDSLAASSQSLAAADIFPPVNLLDGHLSIESIGGAMRIPRQFASLVLMTSFGLAQWGCSEDTNPGSGKGGSGGGGSGGTSATGGAGGIGTGGSSAAGGTGGGSSGSGGVGGSSGTGGSSGGSAGKSGAGGASGGGTGGGGAAGQSGAAGAGTAGSAGARDAGPEGGAGAAGSAGAGGGGGAAGTDGGAGAAGGSPEGGACIGDYVPGDYPPNIADANAWLTISGVQGQPNPRQYKVHVPPGYNCRVPTPLLFCIHGLMQNGVMLCVNGSSGKDSGPRGFVDKSDKEGFVLVIPTGAGNAWNGAGCCGNANLDDVALFKALVAEVSKHVNVDARKVYATGLSNGGYMSHRLACEAADVFTAVAPGAGGLSGITCTPSRPISVLNIHGTADGIVNFSNQASSVNAIAMANGCSTTTMPATVPGSGGDTTCVTRTGCPNGIEVTSCTIQGGGHVWFGDPSCGTGAGAAGCAFVGANSTFFNNTDAAWEFFKRLSR
jgi:polyhydroxybutyrate depolymerase